MSGESSRLGRNLYSIRRTYRWFRPYVRLYVLVIVGTLLAAAAEGGQATLIQPLLNRVLLRGASEDEERADQAWVAKRQGDVSAQAVAAAESDAAAGAARETWAARRQELIDYDGRRSQPGWRADPLCRLLGSSRRQLLDVGLALEEDPDSSPRSWTLLGRGLLLQLQAQAALGPDPLGAAASGRALAGKLSLLARETGRQANFNEAWRTLKLILAAALGLAFVLGASRYTSTSVSRVVVARIYRDMQNAIVERVVTLSAGQLLGSRRGDLIARMTQDLARAVQGVIRPLYSDLALQPLRLLALYLVALWVSWPLALALLAVGLVVLYPIKRWGKHIRRSARRRQSALAEVVQALHQLFAGMRLVKAYRREDYERQRFRARTEEAYEADVGVIKARIASRTWMRIANEVSFPVVILLGGYLIANHYLGLDAGRFAAFAALTVFMYRPARDLTMAYNTLLDNLVSLVRVLEVLDLEPEIVDEAGAVPLETFRGEIRFEGVSFSYDGESEVLSEVSFEAPVGTTTAIVGLTGAGKSTLMDLLIRFLAPTRGRILVDGQDLSQVQVDSWRQRLALVSQSAFLFNASVRENLRYGRLDASDAEIEEAARQARIHEEIVAQPEGYDYLAGEQGSRLSGGQVQRLTLARAFLRKPALLLLDEATSALDTQTERLVQEAIAAAGCTTFVIAHRLSTVRHADQILVLDQGRLVERGRHEELLERGGVYASLVHTLAEGDEQVAAA